MVIEVKVPSPGESISEVQLASWLVEEGSYVDKDQEIAEIDSDKATLSISAEQSGKITFLARPGESIEVGSVIAKIDTKASAPAGKKAAKSAEPSEKAADTSEKPAKTDPEKLMPPAPLTVENSKEEVRPNLSPLARKLLDNNGLNEQEFIDLIRKYRFSKKDVEFFLSEKDKIQSPPTLLSPGTWKGTRESERQKMSTLRLKIADRLVAVKNETAMLTTFNEVNMTPIMKIRQQYRDAFSKKFDINLGFMSFFTKAVTEALQLFPQVNAQIDGDEIIFHHFTDIGIAVSTPKGLMVPVIRNAEKLSLAEIEMKIKDLAERARDNKITLDEMKGGTFTITNGGVFGSMLSTPIINPPQSAILGMHNIVERPVAVNGQVEIHPVMFVALSYDHRIIDGKESVSFLVKVKEMLENPAKMLFGGKDPVVALLGL
ncbi:MAG: 2-oxoglutarate dehydrogenase complex dihydrolipoyllysine-residue succinyltransferase [Bacteroidales bacterium]|nr:2-oxoglutarate dehydrogenase complex dihydrolipoyllysine-residue succinyltransferase [Bacteroidales bacterium]